MVDALEPFGVGAGCKWRRSNQLPVAGTVSLFHVLSGSAVRVRSSQVGLEDRTEEREGMRWISSKELQREFGFTRAVSEKVIREQLVTVGKEGWRSWVMAACFAAGMIWMLLLAQWLVPTPAFHNWYRAMVQLPGVLLIAARWLVLPRLLAGDAILASAHVHAESAYVEPDNARQEPWDSGLA